MRPIFFEGRFWPCALFHTFFEIFEEMKDDFQFFWLAPIKRPFFFEQAHFFLMGAFLMRPSGAHFFFFALLLNKSSGVWSSDGVFRQQNHNWLSAKKVEMIRIITRAFWEFRKIYMTYKSIVQSKMQSIFRQQNRNWLTDTKSKRFMLLHEHFEKNYVKFIRRKRV